MFSGHTNVVDLRQKDREVFLDLESQQWLRDCDCLRCLRTAEFLHHALDALRSDYYDECVDYERCFAHRRHVIKSIRAMELLLGVEEIDTFNPELQQEILF